MDVKIVAILTVLTILTVLAICKFTVETHWIYLVDKGGLVDWNTFTMLESEAFTRIIN